MYKKKKILKKKRKIHENHNQGEKFRDNGAKANDLNTSIRNRVFSQMKQNLGQRRNSKVIKNSIKIARRQRRRQII